MVKKTITPLSFLALGLIVAFVGCKGDNFGLAPVSGIVTLDGEPVEGVQVMFTPNATADTSIVGPWSAAVTDASGKFTLKTRKFDPGAVIGEHTVSCQFLDFDPDAISGLQEQIQEAKQNEEDVTALMAKLEKVKNIKGIPDKYAENSTIKVTVPAGGLTDHKIELTSE